MASSVEKIAISIDRELLREIERIRRRTGESRSGIVTRAVRAIAEAEQNAAEARAYVEAYRRMPEKAQEVAVARKLAVQSLAGLDWSDELTAERSGGPPSTSVDPCC